MTDLTNAELVAAFENVARIMRVERGAWCVIGGAAALLSGVDMRPLNDIDVLMTPDAARRVLSANGLTETKDGGTAKFRSEVFCRIYEKRLQVDLLGGFEVKGSNGWAAIAPKPRRTVQVGSAKIPLPELDEMIAMHRSFGRFKDAERVKLLELAKLVEPATTWP